MAQSFKITITIYNAVVQYVKRIKPCLVLAYRPQLMALPRLQGPVCCFEKLWCLITVIMT